MIELGKQNITLDDFKKVLRVNEKVKISSRAVGRINHSFEFLKEFSQDKVIYGINTGFGPMAQYRIDNGNQKQLQFNLIRSHAAGTGDYISAPDIKAAMLVLANNLSQGILAGPIRRRKCDVCSLQQPICKVRPKIFRTPDVRKEPFLSEHRADIG